MEEYDHDDHMYRVNFVNSRLIELKAELDDLVELMQEKYTNTEAHRLKQTKEQIKYHESLLMALDDGQEYFELEN
jgi:hypothetical protein